MVRWILHTLGPVVGIDRVGGAYSAPVVMKQPTQTVLPEWSYRESIREEGLDSRPPLA